MGLQFGPRLLQLPLVQSLTDFSLGLTHSHSVWMCSWSSHGTHTLECAIMAHAQLCKNPSATGAALAALNDALDAALSPLSALEKVRPCTLGWVSAFIQAAQELKGLQPQLETARHTKQCPGHCNVPWGVSPLLFTARSVPQARSAALQRMYTDAKAANYFNHPYFNASAAVAAAAKPPPPALAGNSSASQSAPPPRSGLYSTGSSGGHHRRMHSSSNSSAAAPASAYAVPEQAAAVGSAAAAGVLTPTQEPPLPSMAGWIGNWTGAFSASNHVQGLSIDPADSQRYFAALFRARFLYSKNQAPQVCI